MVYYSGVDISCSNRRFSSFFSITGSPMDHWFTPSFEASTPPSDPGWPTCTHGREPARPEHVGRIGDVLYVIRVVCSTMCRCVDVYISANYRYIYICNCKSVYIYISSGMSSAEADSLGDLLLVFLPSAICSSFAAEAPGRFSKVLHGLLKHPSVCSSEYL